MSENTKTGFTLIEFLMTISIVVILTGFVVFNYTKGGGLVLQRASNKLTMDLRKAQEMAMSARQPNTICGGVPSNLTGYGIYFNELTIENEKYILFANCDANQVYDSGVDDIVEDINIERDVKISNIEKDDLSDGSSSPNFLSVFFKPPDPTIYIEGSSSGYEAQITLCWQDSEVTKTKIIKINNAGRVEIIE